MQNALRDLSVAATTTTSSKKSFSWVSQTDVNDYITTLLTTITRSMDSMRGCHYGFQQFLASYVPQPSSSSTSPSSSQPPNEWWQYETQNTSIVSFLHNLHSFFCDLAASTKCYSKSVFGVHFTPQFQLILNAVCICTSQLVAILETAHNDGSDKKHFFLLQHLSQSRCIDILEYFVWHLEKMQLTCCLIFIGQLKAEVDDIKTNVHKLVCSPTSIYPR